MPNYLCSNGKEERNFTTKHELKPGDTIIAGKGNIFEVIQKETPREGN
jgi:hypothetical protein